MKKTMIYLTMCAAAVAAEPQYNNSFAALDASGGLVPLEKQTATIHAGVKAFGYGGFKASTEFKPAQSPTRFKSADRTAFVVRSPLPDTVDPNTIYVLRVLKGKSNRRELIITETRFMMIGGMNHNLAEGVQRVTFERFGEHSLKITSDEPLPPGEYALSIRQGMLDLFCFGIDK